MSIVWMEGFDAITHPDELLAKGGWITAPLSGTVSQRRPSFSAPSQTGVAGRSLSPANTAVNGAYQVMSDGAINPGLNSVATGVDFLVRDTGVTVNQAWQAGGFAYGCSAKFSQISDWGAAAPRSFTWDPVRNLYVRIDVNKQFSTSTDTITWTPTVSQPVPVNAVAANDPIRCFSDGTWIHSTPALTVGTTAANTSYSYSTNGGVTWTSQATNSGHTSTTMSLMYGETTNATYPHLMVFGDTTVNTSGGVGIGLYVGNLTGTMTKVLAVTSPATAYNLPTILSSVVGGYVYVLVNGTIWSCPVAQVNTAASWVSVTVTGVTSAQSLAFSSTCNAWVLGHTGGIAVLNNPGTSASPLPPTSGTPRTLTYVNAGGQVVTPASSTVYNVIATNSSCVALGGLNANLGINYWSTDGTTWNISGQLGVWGGQLLANQGTNINATALFVNYGAVWDGTRIVARATTGYLNSHITSVDGINNWNVLSSTISSSNSLGTPGYFNGLGFTTSTAALTQATNWTCGTRQAIMYPAAVAMTSSTQVMSVNTAVVRTAAQATGTVIAGTGVHYYEIQAVSDPSNVNQFVVTFYIDGTVVGSSVASALYGSSASDTTSRFVLTFPRSYYWWAFDDMYVALIDGNGSSGPFGQINIQTARPQADVGTPAWTKGGLVQSSNAQTVRANSYSQAQGYVTSSAAGNIDQYSTDSSVANIYNVVAVQAEAWGTKTSAKPATVEVGITSGTVDSFGTAVKVGATPTQLATAILEKDPNTGAKWTAAGANAATIKIEQVS